MVLQNFFSTLPWKEQLRSFSQSPKFWKPGLWFLARGPRAKVRSQRRSGVKRCSGESYVGPAVRNVRISGFEASLQQHETGLKSGVATVDKRLYCADVTEREVASHTPKRDPSPALQMSPPERRTVHAADTSPEITR